MSQSPEYIYSEGPAIELFQRLGYGYYNAAQQDERKGINEVILKSWLLNAIRRINPWINEYNLHKAFEKLTGVQGASLMEINQKVWELLRGPVYIVKQVIAGQEEHRPVSFIDYQNPANNDFLLVNQMKYHGRYQNSTPDLVVYINGLPIGAIECKSPNVAGGQSWDKAYNDLAYYQENSEKLFHYNQLCADIWQVGGCYGAIGAPQAYYSVFKTIEVAALTEPQ
jgi:type I restriction enzyme R subunit